MGGEGGQGFEGGGQESSVASEGTQEGGSSLNPAWNDLMGIIPSQLHSQVTPHLSQWDKNYQDGINKVHSQYEAYKPYMENEISPDQINYGLQLMYALEQNPRGVLEALAEANGVSIQEAQEALENEQQGQGETDPSEPEWLNHPKFQELNQMVETMAQLMVQQNQTVEDQQEDEALAQELDALHEEHGDFDEDWVLTKVMTAMQRGQEMSIADAVNAYNEHKQGILAESRKPGPKVLSANGHAPDSQISKEDLASDGSRKALVMQMLQAAQQNQ